jgi:hypothetical protein
MRENDEDTWRLESCSRRPALPMRPIQKIAAAR